MSATDSGAAYIFVSSGGLSTQQAYLKPAVFGTSQAGDAFGSSVALSGDTVVIGAHYEDSSTSGVNSSPNENLSEFGLYGDFGAAYIFVRSAGVWRQQDYLKPAEVGIAQGSR